MHNFFIVRPIRHIPKFHPAVKMFSLDSLSRRFYIRLLSISRINFFHGSREPLNIVHPPSCHTQRHGQHPQITVHRHQISHRDFPLNDHISAIQHENYCQQMGQHFENGQILFPDFGRIQLRRPKSVVFLIEFADFKIFLRKSPDDPVSADIFLYESI